MINLFHPEAFKGKTLLVTGGTSGIGKQIVVEAAQLGARVHAVGRNVEKLAEVRLTNPNINLHQCDIRNDDELDVMVKGFEGKFDGVVHAAGITDTIPLKYTTSAKVKNLLDTNVVGGISLIQKLVKRGLINSPGSIILMASVVAEVGDVGKTAYALTKGAIKSAAKSMALELASKKIRVNTVSPGVVVTPLSESSPYSKSEIALNRMIEEHPLGLGKPEDVSGVCLFLLSEASGWVTGTDWKVDGGYTVK